MDNQQYKNYILKKYKTGSDKFGVYAKVDAMEAFLDPFMQEGIIFKGAFNLMLNFNYRRSEITKDIDVSLKSIDMKNFINDSIKRIETFEVELYEYSVSGSENLSIKTNGYDGVGLSISCKLKGTNIKLPFSIDVAVEELKGKGLIRINGMDVYTLERTLADKFVSMIQWGSKNGREKDFIDLKELYKECNKKELFTLSKELIDKRNVSNEEVASFIKEFTSYEYIIKYSLTATVEELIKNTLSLI